MEEDIRKDIGLEAAKDVGRQLAVYGDPAGNIQCARTPDPETGRTHRLSLLNPGLKLADLFCSTPKGPAKNIAGQCLKKHGTSETAAKTIPWIRNQSRHGSPETTFCNKPQTPTGCFQCLLMNTSTLGRARHAIRVLGNPADGRAGFPRRESFASQLFQVGYFVSFSGPY